MDCQVDKKNRIFETSFLPLIKVICAVCGEDTIAKRTALKWFAQFKLNVNDRKNGRKMGKCSEQ